MSESIRALTHAIATGDTEAFGRFYGRWFDFALAQARRCSGRDEHFCLDVVQETMMRVIRSIKPMETELDVGRWLRAIVQSCCYDLLRRERRRDRRERAARTDREGASIGRETDDRLIWLRSELANLDPELARLLSLRFRLGWTLQRIGAAVGLKPGAVDGRLTRALASLRARAPEDFHE